jgi:hypothetical protein
MKGKLIETIFIIFSYVPLFAEEKRPDEFPVVSYRNLEVGEFNLQIILC